MADKPKQTKIVLLTGYLGAGKTTLLNHILSSFFLRITLVRNFLQ